MYLEISNIAAALGKNPYEPKELIQLLLWARINPGTLLDFLLNTGLIINHDKEEKELMEIDDKMSCAYNEINKNIDKKKFTALDIKSTTEKVVEKYKEMRPNCTDEEVKVLEDSAKKQFIKENGNIQEHKTIENKNYKKGNNKMYYFNITDKDVIGGRHDADTTDDIVIEIKARTTERNVRKNEYDLYQLIGYLICMNKTKGKIVQNYNKKIYDSDEMNDKEYGLVDINDSQWSKYIDEIKSNLVSFFYETEQIIHKQTFEPENIKKITKFGLIAELTIDGTFININQKFKKIISMIENNISC